MKITYLKNLKNNPSRGNQKSDGMKLAGIKVLEEVYNAHFA